MTLRKLLIVCCLLWFSLAIYGCGGNEVKSGLRTHSLGQELTDLEKAYTQGALTADEFEDAKENIIHRYR